MSEISHVSCNSLSVHLFDSVLHSHQIAARRLRGVAQWVLGEFRLMHPTQEFVLLPETFEHELDILWSKASGRGISRHGGDNQMGSWLAVFEDMP